MPEKMKSRCLVYQQGAWRSQEIEVVVRSLEEQKKERQKAGEAIAKKLGPGV